MAGSVLGARDVAVNTADTVTVLVDWEQSLCLPLCLPQCPA